MSIVDDAIAQDVRAYAAQVRAALADLGPENVDDLTDGLEANLTDALADDRRAHGGSLDDDFGTPEAYAAELRAAAGLPTSSGHPRREDPLRSAWRGLRDSERTALARLRATGWFPHVEDLLVALRPAWWVARGWVLAHLLLQVVGAERGTFWLPSSLGGWVLLLLAVVASAQWGRGEWRAGPRWDRVLRVLSRVLAVAGVILVLTLPDAHGYEVAAAQSTVPAPPQDGVVVAGETAENLFVYDADGNPVDGAQVFDQDGRPVTTEPDAGDPWRQREIWPDGADEPLLHVGVPGVNGETRWNVFPLHSLSRGAWGDGGALDLRDRDVRDQVVAPTWPFATAAGVEAWGRSSGVTPGPGTGAGDATAPDVTPGPSAGAGDPTTPDAPATEGPAPDAPATAEVPAP